MREVELNKLLTVAPAIKQKHDMACSTLKITLLVVAFLVVLFNTLQKYAIVCLKNVPAFVGFECYADLRFLGAFAAQIPPSEKKYPNCFLILLRHTQDSTKSKDTAK